MLDINKGKKISWVVLLCLATAGQIRAAEDDALLRAMEDTDAAERCISLSRIDNTRILDNSNILFYMRRDKIYLNNLPHRCPGLKSAGTYMYRSSIDRLCNVDFITVLHSSGGGYSPGAGCGLGLFFPIEEELAKELLKKSR